jgi:amino acid transporter
MSERTVATDTRGAPPGPGASAGARPPGVQLRANAVSLVEMVGQSLAAIAPTLTPALNISVVAGLAGIGTWLAFLIGTLGVVIVAASVATLASRHPEAGSYFVYIGRGLGPFAGALAGWAMISAYLFTAISVGMSFTIFLADFLREFGIALTPPPMIAAMLLFIAFVTYGAYRDLRLSSRVGLLLEAVSVCIIVAITVLIVRARGTAVDPAQLDFTNLKYGALVSSLPFVIFCFVGFESAATLAKESADPRRNVGLAVIGCAGFAGIFFTLMGYFMVFGSGDDTGALARSTAPFGDVAAKAGLGWAATVVYFAAMISVFACALACVNAASRLLYSMGKYGFLHGSMGRVHDVHRTPHRAILLCGALVAVTCLAMVPLGFLNAFGYAATLASFGFVVVYLALCIVAPLDLRRSRAMRLRHASIGALGAALMGFVLFGSVYPPPDHPYELLPYFFLAYLAVGAAWFAWLKRRSPATLVAIQHDMES